MIDYIKGSRMVIIEEFLITISRIPELYRIPFSILAPILKYLLLTYELIFKYLEIFNSCFFTLEKENFFIDVIPGLDSTSSLANAPKDVQ